MGTHNFVTLFWGNKVTNKPLKIIFFELKPHIVIPDVTLA